VLVAPAYLCDRANRPPPRVSSITNLRRGIRSIQVRKPFDGNAFRSYHSDPPCWHSFLSLSIKLKNSSRDREEFVARRRSETRDETRIEHASVFISIPRRTIARHKPSRNDRSGVPPAFSQRMHNYSNTTMLSNWIAPESVRDYSQS
jgi:hypothetical protein